MPKLRPTKSASQPTVDKVTTEASPKTIKKQGSLRTLFSFWKFSKKAPAVSETSSTIIGGPGSKKLGLSTASLPARVSTRERSDSEGSENSSRGTNSSISTTSLPSEVRPPFAHHAPSSSSSSASSLELTSETSTAATSPSNSSPSILIKSLSSASIATIGSTTSVADASPVERNNPPNQVSSKSTKLSKPLKRPMDNYQKQPSPLSNVMDAHSPYTFSTPPRPGNKNQPRRRSSLGNFLLRRSQSNPDLADLTQEYLPPLPPMPASGSSRPGTSNSMLRTKTFRRRSGDPRKSEGGYTEDQKIERMSILGADPAGYGYHLYPTPKPETSNKTRIGMGPGKRGRPGHLDDWKRHSWGSGLENSYVSTAGPSSKAWKDARGRSFRRTVTQAIPEEAGDSFDSNDTASKTQSEEKRKRAQSPHNNWNSINVQKQTQELSSLEVPSAETKVKDSDENVILRQLQHGAQRAMDAADSAAEGLDERVINFTSSTSGTEHMKAIGIKGDLPVVRVDMVKV